MNKKVLFAATIAPMAILASCGDDEIATGNAAAPVEVAEAANEVTPLAVYLTDQRGNRVENLGGDFGIYNLHIEGAEAWIIKSNKAFVSVLDNKGTGDAVIPVYVATCWGDNRDAILSVKTLDLDAPATRGTSEMVEDTEIGINQAPAYGYTYFSRFGSNVGVGFAYNPLRSDETLLAIGQPVFDIEALLEEGLIHDDTNFTNTEEITIESSEAKLHEKLMVKGGINGKFAKVAFSGSGSYGTNHDTDESNWVSVMTKSSVIFQREMNYLDVAYSENKHLSTGFTYMAKVLNDALTAATTYDERSQALDDFFTHYGPFFIYRAQLGAQLDYTCTISKSVLKDSTDLAAAIQIKFKTEVVKSDKKDDSSSTDKKDDSGSSSDKKDESNTEEYPDDDASKAISRFFAENSESLEGNADDKGDDTKKDYNNLDIDASGKYEKYLSDIASSTNAKLDIKGGTTGVSILASGGTLNAEDLEAWTKNITPNNAILGDFLVAPIYLFFKEDTPAYKYLKEFVDNGELKKE